MKGNMSERPLLKISSKETTYEVVTDAIQYYGVERISKESGYSAEEIEEYVKNLRVPIDLLTTICSLNNRERPDLPLHYRDIMSCLRGSIVELSMPSVRRELKPLRKVEISSKPEEYEKEERWQTVTKPIVHVYNLLIDIFIIIAGSWIIFRELISRLLGFPQSQGELIGIIIGIILSNIFIIRYVWRLRVESARQRSRTDIHA